MVYCAKCGTQIDEGSAFCQNCGAAAPGAAAPPPPAAAPYVTAPPAAAGTKSNGLAVGSLVAGIVSFIFNPILLVSIAAIVLGVIARGKIKKDPGLKGNGMATAGIILGVVSVVISIIVMAIAGFSIFGILGA